MDQRMAEVEQLIRVLHSVTIEEYLKGCSPNAAIRVWPVCRAYYRQPAPLASRLAVFFADQSLDGHPSEEEGVGRVLRQI
jgi:hypothetical protein